MNCRIGTSLKMLILALGFLSFCNVLAQTPGVWDTWGPTGSQSVVRHIFTDPANPEKIYAATFDRGLFRSANAGITWRQSKPPLNDKLVTKMIWVSGTIYAKASGNLFQSIDDGMNWIQSNPPSDKKIEPLISVSDTIYVGTTGDGVFRTTDMGITWIQSRTPMNDKHILELVSLEGIRFSVTKDDGLYLSEDGGEDWTRVNDPINDMGVTGLISGNGKLFTKTSSEDIVRSLDGGRTWTHIPLQLSEFTSMGPLFYFNETLYTWRFDNEFFWGHGVYFSRDDGLTWQGSKSPMDIQAVTNLIWADGKLYAGTENNGVFWSADEGENWTQSNAPLREGWVHSLLWSEGTLYAGRFIGFFKSADGGKNWVDASNRYFQSISVSDGVTIDKFNQDVIVSYGRNGVFQSPNAGTFWSQVDQPLGALHINTLKNIFTSNFVVGTKNGLFEIDIGRLEQADAPMNDKDVTFVFNIGNLLYAGTRNNGLFKRDRLGNWIQENVPMNDKQVTAYVPAAHNLNLRVVGTKNNGIFRQWGTAGNWAQANPPMTNMEVTALFFDWTGTFEPEKNRIIHAGTAANGIFRSTDDGENWTQVNLPIDVKRVTTFISTVDRTIFAGTQDLGIFWSPDEGENWYQASAPMNNKTITTMVSVDDILYAGTEKNGVFKSYDGENWLPLQLGLGKRKVNELAYSSDSNLLYAAAEFSGVYLQTLDNTAPTNLSTAINGGAAFSNKRQVTLSLDATDADSVIIAEDTLFTINSTRWQVFQKNPLFFNLSSDEGPKTLHAKFKDISWNESEVISAQIILDTTPPSFLPHAPPTNAILGNNVTINQQIIEANLQSMDLYYRRAGETWSENLKATFQGDTAEIDGAFITNRGIDYRIIAADFAGQSDTLRNGNLDFFSVPVNLSTTDLGDSPGLPAGFAGSAYRLVSAPMKLEGSPNVKSLFGDFGEYGENGDWRFWTYQGNDEWREGDNISVGNGSGYFLILRNGGNLTNQVSGTSTKTTDGVLGNISGWSLRANDWTMIGNPYNTRIELGQLKLQQLNKRLNEQDTNFQVWGYDGSGSNKGWTNVGIALEPWSGLAIRVSQADKVVFANPSDPYTSSLGKSQLVRLATFNPSEGEWLIQVRAESQEFSDLVNYFGVRRDAHLEQDVSDWYEPPILPGGISLSFPHPEWTTSASFASDIRPATKEGYSWNLKLKANGGSIVLLNFENISSVPEEFEVLLLDDQTGVVRDLRNQSEISTRMPKGTRTKTFTILAGKDGFISERTIGLKTVPETFTLLQNYPNPFNPSTVIRYEIPESGVVSLKIYDLLGREVMSAVDNLAQEPGYYEKIVDMSGHGSGIYYYQISVNGEKRFQATKKMLYLK